MIVERQKKDRHDGKTGIAVSGLLERQREGINDEKKTGTRKGAKDSLAGLAATLIPREYARPQTRADALSLTIVAAFHSLPFRRPTGLRNLGKSGQQRSQIDES